MDCNRANGPRSVRVPARANQFGRFFDRTAGADRRAGKTVGGRF
jgi:hypothetical protein